MRAMASWDRGPAEIRLSGRADDVPLARWGLRRPGPVLVVVGTTAALGPELHEALLPMFAAAVAAAGQRDAALVTGGTDVGVFHVLGSALSSAARPPQVVVGVAPDRLVGGQAPVAPQLSLLVRVPGSAWGDETPALSDVVARLSGRSPAVVLLAGGGEVSRAELVEHLGRGRSVAVVAGTGRLADDVARRHAEAETEDDLGALLADGDVHIVTLEDGPLRLHDVLTALLTPPR